MASTINLMNAAADRLASDAINVGYDQGQRFTFVADRHARPLVFIANRECDCSSSTAAIATFATPSLDLRDPIYTGNIRQRLVGAGWSCLSVDGWSRDRLAAELRAGDVLLGPGHVVYVREDHGTRIWSAENDERGTSSGGRAGDQTGVEARYRSLYMRSRGWDWIVRPPASEAPGFPLVSVTPESDASTAPRYPRQGSTGDDVARIQRIVGVTVDGVWGPITDRAVRAYQRKVGVTADGIWGPATEAAHKRYVGSNRGGTSNELAVDGAFGRLTIRALQDEIGTTVDGVWGPKSEKSLQEWAGLTGRHVDGIRGPVTVRAVQRKVGATVDGIWGPQTTRALQRYLNAH